MLVIESFIVSLITTNILMRYLKTRVTAGTQILNFPSRISLTLSSCNVPLSPFLVLALFIRNSILLRISSFRFWLAISSEALRSSFSSSLLAWLSSLFWFLFINWKMIEESWFFGLLEVFFIKLHIFYEWSCVLAVVVDVIKRKVLISHEEKMI